MNIFFLLVYLVRRHIHLSNLLTRLVFIMILLTDSLIISRFCSFNELENNDFTEAIGWWCATYIATS